MFKTIQKLGVIFLLLFCCSSLQAKNDTEHRNLAEKFLLVTEVDKQVQQYFDQIKQTQQEQIEAEKDKMFYNVAEDKIQNYIEKINSILDLMAKDLAWVNLKEKYIDVYVQNYSQTELKELINFYKSPLGQKHLNKSIEIAPQLMQIGQDIYMQNRLFYQQAFQEASAELISMPPVEGTPVPADKNITQPPTDQK